MFIGIYIQQISGERLQDHWSSGWFSHDGGPNVGWAIIREKGKYIYIYMYTLIRIGMKPGPYLFPVLFM